MNEELKWNYSEFTCFLLIHASYADMEFSQDEKTLIMNKFGKAMFENIADQYDSMGEYERLNTIMQYKGVYYPTSDRKAELLSEIETLCNADGDYSRLEKTLIMFLNKML